MEQDDPWKPEKKDADKPHATDWKPQRVAKRRGGIKARAEHLEMLATQVRFEEMTLYIDKHKVNKAEHERRFGSASWRDREE